jgi:hypothetical protein
MQDIEKVKEWARADQKGEAPPELSAWLRNEGLDLWIEALSSILRQITADMANKKSLVDEAALAGWAPHVRRQAKLDYATWKRKALAVQCFITDALAEAKRLRHEREQARMDERSVVNNLCVDMADLLDDLMERRLLTGDDFARADELLATMPEWLDSPRVVAARERRMA